MQTEQKPSLPDREKTLKKSQVKSIRVDFKDLPNQSEFEEFRLSEMVRPSLVSEEIKDFIYSLFDNDKDRLLFAGICVAFFFNMSSKTIETILDLAIDTCKIQGHIKNKDCQVKLRNKAKELDERVSKKHKDITLRNFHQNKVSRTISE